MRTLVLHLGVHKTGSSAIQHALASYEARLAAAGILYPRAGRPRIRSVRFGQHALAWAVLRRNGADPSIYDELASEIRTSGAQTVVISTEEFDRFRAYEIARLRDVVTPLFDRVRIVAYLRRQSDVIQGLYGTDIVYNRVVTPIEAYVATLDVQLDYEALEADWSRLADGAELILRPYEDAVRRGDGLLADFLSAAGLPADALADRPRERQNVSLPWHAALSIQHMWRLGFPGPVVFETIETLKMLLREEAGGRYGFWPPTRAATFDAGFAESNARLVARYPHLGAALAPADRVNDEAWKAVHRGAWSAVTETLAAVNRRIREKMEKEDGTGPDER